MVQWPPWDLACLVYCAAFVSAKCLSCFYHSTAVMPCHVRLPNNKLAQNWEHATTIRTTRIKEGRRDLY